MARRYVEKPKTVRVTLALVREFVEMDPVPGDRGIKERRLMVYRRILAAGEFRPCIGRHQGPQGEGRVGLPGPVRQVDHGLERLPCRQEDQAAVFRQQADPQGQVGGA
jgi:hypothetical protein